MPTAHADTARTLLGASVVINVLANDAGSTLSIAGYTTPTFGTLVLNPDQSFTYTPPADFVGNDGFTYTVRDALGGTAAADVTIIVMRPNTAPTASNDSAQTLAGDSVVISPLANDNDADGDAFGIIGIDAPGHGTIAVQPGQSIRYTPETGFSGIDSFTYTIGDGQGGVGTANVTITVTARNAAPVAVPDMAMTHTGAPVTIDALANDHDPDGGPISLAGMSMPGHGSLTLTPEQQFVYTPAAGFIGADSFTYSIRDDAGAATTGQVDLTVERSNAPPAPTPDHASSAGEPVTLNLLANDNDPDGDPLRLTALTVPLEGQIAVNTDGTVTYTPPSGFTGTDSFTYQVSDGVAVTEAEVTLAVTAPVIPSYANGYRYRRRLVVPPQAAGSEIATNFALLVRESGNWLKSTANGGKVQHAQGFDLRFELEDGTKLDHEVERHDLAAGSLLAWVRLPSLDLARELRLFLYYGKGSLTATEANPTGVWQAYLAVYNARTGADRTGNGRTLTPAGIGSGELLGDAGSFNGSAVASRNDASFLNGQTAVTVQAMATADAATIGSSHGILAQGPMDGSDGSAGLVLQYLQQASDGTPNVVHFKVTCADGAAFVLSGANLQRTQTQLLHGVWRQGQRPALYIDGVEAATSSVSAARSGLTTMASGGLYLGAGARDPATGGWRGLIDEVRIAATAFPAQRIAAEAANLATPQGLYGLGDEDQVAQADQAPVAVPIRVATTAATHVDVDAPAAAYDPDGPGPCELVGVGAPAHGVATATGSVIRYTPVAGYIGRDWFSYTLDNAGKRSSSWVFVNVAAAATSVYAYEHRPPASILPASDADIIVWNIPAAGGTVPSVGNPDQVLLMSAPAEPITGAIQAQNLRYRAAFLIGATLRRRGSTSTQPPAGGTSKGGHVFQISFVNGLGIRPVLFLANLDYDARNAVANNDWGDFLRFGTKPNAAKDNFDEWLDLYMQKIKVPFGNYGFTGQPGDDDAPHSDFTQAALGGFRDAYLGDIDLAWNYQTWFLKGANITNDTCCPNGRLWFKDVMMRALPAAPRIYTGDGWRLPIYTQTIGNPSESTAQLNAGNYYASYFTNVYAERSGAPGGNTIKDYIRPNSTPGGSNTASGNRVNLPYFKASNRTYPLWSGYVDFVEPPTPVVTADEVGHAVRVQTPARLRQIMS
ncbi:MAG: DUF2341 domain-containing protein [Geminicoccaceae bacterium]